MKRKLFLFILAVAVCLTTLASSVELTFEQTAMYALGESARVYVLDEDTGALTAATTLPAGYHVIPNGESQDGKKGITYGFGQYGFVDSDVPIVKATVGISLPNGETAIVSDKLPQSKTALNLWLETEYGVTLDETYTDEEGTEHAIGNEAAEGEADIEDVMAREAKYQTAKGRASKNNGSSTYTVFLDDAGNETDVQVCFMGLARSKVIMNGQEQMVDTWRLAWDSEAPEDKQIAVVTPKDASNVRLYATNKEKATILGRVSTTRVVRVIKTDKTWTLVDTDDDDLPRGYIKTAVLTFYPNVKVDYRPALLTVGGSTKPQGEDNLVRAREKGSRKGREIGKFDLGEQLSVFPGEEGSEWSEVDVAGYHAYIQSEYVTFSGASSSSASKPITP